MLRLRVQAPTSEIVLGACAYSGFRKMARRKQWRNNKICSFTISRHQFTITTQDQLSLIILLHHCINNKAQHASLQSTIRLHTLDEMHPSNSLLKSEFVDQEGGCAQ